VKLEGRVAIVTGASRGIGRGIALELAREGADVVVASRTEKEGGKLPGTIHSTAGEIRELGRRALAVRTDITKEEDVEAMVAKTLDEFGTVDILVNNAGVNAPSGILDTTVKRWDIVIAVNLRGTFLCAKAVLPVMVEKKSGSIINVSSLAGTRVPFWDVAYGVSKAAVERFTIGLAGELKEHNIAVNCLCPSATDTEGLSLWMPGADKTGWQTPQQWGRYAVFLAAQDAAGITGKVLSAEELDALGAR